MGKKFFAQKIAADKWPIEKHEDTRDSKKWQARNEKRPQMVKKFCLQKRKRQTNGR